MKIKKIDSKSINWTRARYSEIKKTVIDMKIGEAIEIEFPTKSFYKFYYANYLGMAFRKNRYDFKIRTKVLNNEGTKIAVMKLKKDDK